MTTVDSQLTEPAPARRFKFREAVVSDIGCRRKDNQDAFGIAHTDQVSLYIVADGMGGARGGATASTIAVRVISVEAFEASGSLSLSSLKTAVELANKLIFFRSSQDEELTGMGTTLAALAFCGDGVFVAHVGDSRIYRYREGRLAQLTRDHTLVQELVDTGAIPPEEAANHPIAHMLTRSLGPTEAVEVELRALPERAAPGDRFLLCSDGLYNLVYEDEIAAVLSDRGLDEAVKTLLDLALERGGTDNVTILIAEAVNCSDSTLDVQYPGPGSVDCQLSTNAEVDDFHSLMEAVRGQEAAAAAGLEAQGGNGQAPEEAPSNGSAEPQAITSSEPAIDEGLNGGPSSDDFLPFGTSAEADLFDIEGELTAAAAVSEGPEEPRAGQEQDERRPEAEALREYDGAYRKAASDLSKLQLLVFAVLFFAAAFVGYSLVGGRSPAPRQAAPRPQPAPIRPDSTAVATLRHDQLKREIDMWAAQRQGVPLDTPPNVPSPAAQPPISPEQPAEQQTEQKAEQPANQPEQPAQQPMPTAVETQGAAEPSADELAAIIGPQEASQPKTENQPDEERAAIEALKQRVNKPSAVEEPAGADENEALDQPIIWEREAAQVELARERSEQPSEKKEEVMPAEELEKIAVEKSELRAKIADYNAKLEALNLAGDKALNEKRTRLKDELETTDRALKQTAEEMKKAQDGLNMWLAFKREAADTNKIKLADQIAELDEGVRRKKEAYAEGSAKYLDAVDRWQQTPNDVSLASKMGLLGRVMQRKRAELEESVTIAIAENVQRLVTQLSELQITNENLIDHNNQLNRHLGYLAHPGSMKADRKRDLQQTYEKERGGLVERLNDLQQRLPDERETEHRRLNNSSALSRQIQQ